MNKFLMGSKIILLSTLMAFAAYAQEQEEDFPPPPRHAQNLSEE